METFVMFVPKILTCLSMTCSVMDKAFGCEGASRWNHLEVLGSIPTIDKAKKYAYCNWWWLTELVESTHCGSNKGFCARGVMVIVVGNEHGDTSSNPGRDWSHFT